MWASFSKKEYDDTRKLLAGFSIALLLFMSLPFAAFAEGEDTSSPEPAPEVTVLDDEEPEEEPGGADGTEGDGEGGDVSEEPTVIDTGTAVADTELNNEINTSITDVIGSASTTASSTNEALVDNNATSTAATGDNHASSTGPIVIDTGTAIATANIANVINTNIYNSNGFLLLMNMLFGVGTFDLRDLDFAAFSEGADDSYFFGGEENGGCNLEECADEDVSHTVTNTNTAVVTNSLVVRASTGGNSADGSDSYIGSGDAYGAANVTNVVGTNIVDSNYLLVSVNNVGDYFGDIVLPSASFFKKFLSSIFPGFGGGTNISNSNNSIVGNDVSVNAGTGDNTTHGTSSVVVSGDAIGTANVANHVNQNYVGGSSVNILIKVHGDWAGDIFGLPEGLAWERTAAGIRIYDTEGDDETGTSTGCCGASYNVSNTNNTLLKNNVSVVALTGENEINGGGLIASGDAHAAANVTNVVGTNVVGHNWLQAFFNILGNFNGNISFGMPDVWIGGRAESSDAKVSDGSEVVYTYTIANNGDAPATQLALKQRFDSHRLAFDESEAKWMGNGIGEWYIPDLDPGESIEVSYLAKVGENVPAGVTPLIVEAALTQREPDNNEDDNFESVMLELHGSSDDTEEEQRKRAGAPDFWMNKKIVEEDGETTDDGAITLNGEAKTVDYKIIVKNRGGRAYNTMLTDVITGEDGEVVSEQEWDLGTVLENEEIVITYTIEFSAETEPGIYTNDARVEGDYRSPHTGKASPRVYESSASLTVHEGITIEEPFVEMLESMIPPTLIDTLIERTIVEDVTETSTAPTLPVVSMQNASGTPFTNLMAAALFGFPSALFGGSCEFAAVIVLAILALFYIWSLMGNFPRNEYSKRDPHFFMKNTAFITMLALSSLALLAFGVLCYVWPAPLLALLVWFVVHGTNPKKLPGISMFF